MAFTIDPIRPCTHGLAVQTRIIGDLGQLVGLITSAPHGEDPRVRKHRIELMMKIDHTMFGDNNAAVAYVRGAEAAMRAFSVIPTKK